MVRRVPGRRLTIGVVRPGGVADREAVRQAFSGNYGLRRDRRADQELAGDRQHGNEPGQRLYD